MSAEERAKAEFEKEKQKFEEERMQYQREKLELQTVKELATKNLPTEFATFILGKDAESTLENIKTFEKQWQSALEKAVNEKLKGSTPKAGGSTTTTNNPYSREHWSLTKQAELEQKDPTLAKQLQEQAK